MVLGFKYKYRICSSNLKTSIIHKFKFMSVNVKNGNCINLSFKETYKWEISNKLILKIEHITFLMT